MVTLVVGGELVSEFQSMSQTVRRDGSDVISLDSAIAQVKGY